MANGNNPSIASRIRRLRVGGEASFPIRQYPSVRTRIYEIRRIFPEWEIVTDTTTNRNLITVIRKK